MCTIPTTWNKIHAYLWNSKREREREGSKLYGVWRCTSLSWLEQLIGPCLPNANRCKCQGHCTPCVHTRLVKGVGPRGQSPGYQTKHFSLPCSCLSMSIQVFSVWSEGPTFAGSACTAFGEMSTDCDKGKVQVYRSASNAWLWFVVTLCYTAKQTNVMQQYSTCIVGPSRAKLVKHVQHRTSVNHAGQVALMHLHAFTWNESAARPFPAKGWRGFLLVESSGSMWQPKPNCARRPTTCWVAASQAVLHCFASSFAKRNMQNGASSSDAAMNFGKWDARPWRQAWAGDERCPKKGQNDPKCVWIVWIVFVISYLFSSKGSPASYCDLFLSVDQPVDQSNVTVKAKQPRAAQAVSPVPAPTRDFTLFLTWTSKQPREQW